MILLVEDNKKLNENIKEILSKFYEVESVFAAEDAEEEIYWKNKNFDLIILDINLSWKNWFEFLKELRGKWYLLPVLILTSKNTTEDKIEWLEIWADDYLSKPFDLWELLARINALLRRWWVKEYEKISIWWYEFYPQEKKVMKDWWTIWLSVKEFNILYKLIKNKWKVFSKKELYEEIWNEPYREWSRNLDMYISNIRTKILKIDIKSKKWLWYYIE